jgi:hypothetical protein
MLGIKNIVLGELRTRLPTRPRLIFIIFLILTFLIIPGGTCVSEQGEANVDPHEVDVVEMDTLAVYINPILEYVSVDCEPLDRGSFFDLSISTNSTSTLFGETTAIWMRPESQGRYNLTITFQSVKQWNYTIGVYAQDLDFYVEFYGKNLKTSGYFVLLEPPVTRVSGNWTISIMVNSHSRSSPVFVIELPSPVNSILLVTVAGFIVYFNAFLLLDTYFKDKKELVSNRRWFVSGIVIVISALAIYQLYNFTTFTLSGGV